MRLSNSLLWMMVEERLRYSITAITWAWICAVQRVLYTDHDNIHESTVLHRSMDTFTQPPSRVPASLAFAGHIHDHQSHSPPLNHTSPTPPFTNPTNPHQPTPQPTMRTTNILLTLALLFTHTTASRNTPKRTCADCTTKLHACADVRPLTPPITLTTLTA
jgi:hypothetical protein